MLIRDVIKLSKINVSRGRVRTVLTILSITIGIASVLLVSSIGSTGERILINEIEKMGLQGISVFNENNAEELTDRDVTLLKKRFREIESATPMIMDVGSFDFSRISGTAVLIGVGEESTDVYNIRIVHGRKPTIDEIEEKKRVAAIDDELALKAYKRTNVVGKQISVTINGKKENFDIISVIKSQKDGLNRMSGNNIPDFIYLPYTALNEMLEESKENTEPLTLSSYDVKNLLEKSGVEPEQTATIEQDFEENVGKDTTFLASNVAATRTFDIKTPDVIIKVNPDKADLIEKRIIDGRACLVIEINDGLSVNGIDVKI